MEEKTRTKTANRLRVIAQEYFSDTRLNVRKQLLEIADAYDEQNKEIERLAPKSLLFGNLYSFNVIVSDKVPKDQIWFASQEQIEQALKGGSLKS